MGSGRRDYNLFLSGSPSPLRGGGRRMRGAGGVQRAVAPEDLTPPAPLSEAERGEQDKRVTASTSDPSPRPPPRSGEGEKSLASRDEINRISMKRSERPLAGARAPLLLHSPLQDSRPSSPSPTAPPTAAHSVVTSSNITSQNVSLRHRIAGRLLRLASNLCRPCRAPASSSAACSRPSTACRRTSRPGPTRPSSACRSRIAPTRRRPFAATR